MADNNAVASVSAVMTFESSSFSAAQRKMVMENARLRAALKATGAEVDAVAAGTKRFQRVTQEMGPKIVAPWMASSAAVRVMEGNITNNIRAAERFIAQSSVMSGVLQKAFPVIGGVALLGIFGHLIEKVNEFNKRVSAIPEALRAGFEAINDKLEMSNDALQTTLDKKRELFAPSTGNALQVKLDEAKEASDRLVQSLVSANKEYESLVRKQSVGSGESAWSGFKSFAENVAHAYIVTGGGHISADMTPLRGIHQQGTTSLEGTIGSYHGDVDSLARQGKFLRGQMVLDQRNRAGKARMAADQAAVDANTKALTDKLNSEIAALTAKIGAWKGSPSNRANLNIAQGERLWAQQYLQDMSLRKQIGAMPDGRPGKTSTATDITAKLSHEHQKALAGSMKNWQRYNAGDAATFKSQADIGQRMTLASSNAWARGNATRLLAAQDAWASQLHGKIRSEQDVANYNLRLKNTMLTIASRSGSISRSQFARVGAAADTANYNANASANLRMQQQVGIDPVLSQKQKDSILAQLQLEKQKMDEERRLMAMRDQAAIQSASAFGGISRSLMQFAQSVTDIGSVIGGFTVGTLSSVNGAIGAAAAGQHNTFRGFGRAMIAGSTTMGLNALEGYGIKGLFGKSIPKKADGYHVFVDNFPKALKGVGAAGKSVIGGLGGGLLAKMNDSNFFSSLMGGKLFGSGSLFGGSGASGVLSAASTFLPMLGFAGGGSPPLHRLSMVGEHGPEVFNPGGVRGTIIPNHALGGSSTVNIDARATNPAMVQSAVMRGMALAYAGAVHTSATQQSDAARRKP